MCRYSVDIYLTHVIITIKPSEVRASNISFSWMRKTEAQRLRSDFKITKQLSCRIVVG